jgi:hypothetical protein
MDNVLTTLTKLLEISEKQGAASVAVILVLILMIIFFVYNIKNVKTVTKLSEEIKNLNSLISSIMSKGWQSDEQAEIVRNYGYGRSESFKNRFLHELMVLYESKSNGSFKLSEIETKKTVINKFEEVIITIDRDLDKIPNVSRTTQDTEHKIERFKDTYLEEFVEILMTEKKEKVKDALHEVIQRLINRTGY